ncbi:MAG: hypothetical protein AABX19_02395 [Nanoarchaeota archaeon]
MNNLEKRNKFNWKEFIRIVGGITLAGAGLAIIVTYRSSSIWGMTLGFAFIGCGFALMVVEWDG